MISPVTLVSPSFNFVKVRSEKTATKWPDVLNVRRLSRSGRNKKG